MQGNFPLIVGLLTVSLASTAAELKQETTSAFDKYVAATEDRINGELRPGEAFLYVDDFSTDAMKRSYDKLKNGEVLVEKRETQRPGLNSDVPDGMVHHWIAVILIPGVTDRDYGCDSDRARLCAPGFVVASLSQSGTRRCRESQLRNRCTPTG